MKTQTTVAPQSFDIGPIGVRLTTGAIVAALVVLAILVAPLAVDFVEVTQLRFERGFNWFLANLSWMARNGLA